MDESETKSSFDLENECIRSTSTRTSFGSSSNNVPQPDEVIDTTLNQHKEDSMAECSTSFLKFLPMLYRRSCRHLGLCGLGKLKKING